MKLSARIGAVEIEEDEIRLAVVHTGGRKTSITEAFACRAAYESASERFEALVAAVQYARAQIKAKPAAWVLCAKSDNAIARKLTLPFKGKSKVAAAVAFELEPYLAFPIDELAVDYNVIREANGNTEVLAVGVRRTLLEEQLDVLSAGGIEIEGIGLDAMGLTSLLRASQGGSGLTAALHVRDSGSSLVVTQGATLVFLRHLPLTANQFRDEPGAAAREVQNTLRAFQASWPEEDAALPELIVTGRVMPEALRLDFEQELAVSIRYVDLLDGVKFAGRSDLEGPPVAVAPSGPVTVSGYEPGPETSNGERTNAWAALAGVSLTAAGGAYGLDFRTGPLAASTAWSGLTRHMVFSAALALLLLMGYGVYMYVNYQRNRDEIERIGNVIWQYYAEAFPDAPDVQGGRPRADAGGSTTIELMMRDSAAAEQNTDLSDVEVFQRPPLPEILKEISMRMPDSKVRVTSIRIMSTVRRGDLQNITIEGEVVDPGAFDEVMAGLKESTLFKQVENPQRRDESGKATFSVRAYI